MAVINKREGVRRKVIEVSTVSLSLVLAVDIHGSDPPRCLLGFDEVKCSRDPSLSRTWQTESH